MMTKYGRLMRRARRRNLIRADAELIGIGLAKWPKQWSAGVRTILYGYGSDRRRCVLELLWDAIHQEDWNLVAEALDALKALQSGYVRESWKRLHGESPVLELPEPPPKYVQ